MHRRPSANHIMFHCDGFTVSIESDFDFLVGERPGEIHRMSSSRA